MIIKNKAFQLLIAVCLGFILYPYMDSKVISVFYTFSQILKDFLMILLPFLIFFCLSSVLSSFEKAGPILVIGIVLMVILSNACAVMTSYAVGWFTLPMVCGSQKIELSNTVSAIKPYWTLPIQLNIKNELALLAGVLCGVFCGFLKSERKVFILNLLQKGKDGTTYILKKVFITFLPLYVFGFMLKLMHDGSFNVLIKAYGKVFLLSVVLILFYISFMYLLASGFSFSKMISYIATMLPAGLTGFTTMSSMAALPVTMESIEENLKDRSYSEFIAPATANIHMVGDGLNISLTALSLLLMTCHPYPDLSTYFIFLIHYCIVKFSAVGVPGGGVLVILPVVQTYLGLSPELTSLLATIYFLQDALLTSANVMANGAFSILTHRFFRKIKFL